MGKFIFNFDTVKNIKSFNQFNSNGKDNPAYVVTMDYFYHVLDEVHYILINEKNMGSEEAYEFIDKLISIDAQRVRELRDLVNTYYVEKKSKKDCAKEILNKFYKITVVNSEHVPEENIDNETEVLEKRFYHLKNVSPSMFWNFFFKLKNNDIMFNLNFSYINDNGNSINDNNYNFIIKTDEVDVYKIRNVFGRNKIMRKILDITKDDNDSIQFYIGVNNDNKIDFGYLYGGDEYSIGKTGFKNYDIVKIINNSNSKYHNLAYFPFMSTFKSTVKMLNYYKQILKSYLTHYDDINIYMDINNDDLAIVIESEMYDVINEQYINSLLNDNKYTRIKRDWVINTEQKGNKTFYYIIL